MIGLVSRLYLLRRDFVTLWRAFRHPATPRWLKGAMIALVAYVISPLDILPEILGIFGILDDVLLVTWASRWIVSKLPPEVYRDVAPTAEAR